MGKLINFPYRHQSRLDCQTSLIKFSLNAILMPTELQLVITARRLIWFMSSEVCGLVNLVGRGRGCGAGGLDTAQNSEIQNSIIV